MNILYFASTAFYRKPNPSFHLMTSMIEDLLSAGHDIYYVGVHDSDASKQIPDNLENNCHFHSRLVALPKAEKNHFVMRYLRGILYPIKAYSALRAYMKTSDVCFVQSSATILYNTLLARHLSKGKNVIINIQDMFPGSSIASGVMPHKWMQKIFFNLQKIAYRKADVIVGISSDMKRRLIEQGVPEDKIKVILNWFDDNSVREVVREENRFVQKYKMSEQQFCVQYAGTFGYVFDYRIVLQVAELLKNKKDIIFQMIGAGSQKDAFIQAAKDKELDNIQFLPLEPQNMVSDVYSACDVCFIPLKRGVIGNSVPSKAGLLMQCKRAIITSVDIDSDYAKEINEQKIGIACSDESPEAIVDAIMRLYNDRVECKAMGQRGYEYGHELYSRSYNMKKYIELFQNSIVEK